MTQSTLRRPTAPDGAHGACGAGFFFFFSRPHPEKIAAGGGICVAWDGTSFEPRNWCRPIGRGCSLAGHGLGRRRARCPAGTSPRDRRVARDRAAAVEADKQATAGIKGRPQKQRENKTNRLKAAVTRLENGQLPGECQQVQAAPAGSVAASARAHAQHHAQPAAVPAGRPAGRPARPPGGGGDGDTGDGDDDGTTSDGDADDDDERGEEGSGGSEEGAAHCQ